MRIFLHNYRYIQAAQRLFAAFIAISAVACGGGKGEQSDARAVTDPSLEAVDIDAAVKSATDGVVQATVAVVSQNTQVVRGAAGGSLAAVQLNFLPASFDIDFVVTLEEGYSIATSHILKELGISESATVQGVGPAAAVTWTYDEDSARPFTMTLPMPSSSGLKTDQSVVVLYIKNVAQTDDNIVGLVAPKNLTVTGNSVTFTSNSYGVYQAIILTAGNPDAVKDVKTKDPIGTVHKHEPLPGSPSPSPGVPGEAPLAFAIDKPEKDLMGLNTTVSWSESGGADTFDVAVDGSDKSCANPGKVYKGVKAYSQAIEPVAGAVNYICVVAVNESGKTGASNNGRALMVDRDVPPTPNKPKIEAPKIATLRVQFNWDAVVDKGAGLNNYHLEIGTSPNANDVLVSDPVKTSDFFFGRTGQTYYARVRAEDKAGNFSGWSASSAAITVDTSLPGSLSGFSAASGPSSGDVNLVFNFTDSEAFKYQAILVSRVAGATAPADCSSPVQTITDFSDRTIVDATGAADTQFSYRVCIKDKSAYVTPVNTATATSH